MKNRKRILSFFLAMVMVFTAAPQVFADTFNVGTADDILNNWNTTFNDTFNMTDNIDMGGSTLDANMYHSYTINGNGHTLSNVSIGSEAVFGEPDVTINANVTGTDDTALEVSGNVEVTVNGNVTSNNNNYTALSASDGAEVTVNNVTKTNGNGDAVLAIQGSTVTVKQDVTLDSNLSRPSGSFAVAAEDSTVTVKDDVTSDQNGIFASGEDAKVTVGDDVTVDSKFGTSSGSALNVHGGADTTIGGDVESSNMSHIRDSSTVTIKGDYTSDKGLYLHNGNVTVNGDVAVGDQTYLNNSSTLTVNGSYTSDEEGFNMSGSTLTVKGDVTTNGQTSMHDSDAKIYGDFTGQEANGVTMDGGIYVGNGSYLYTGDGSTLETDQLHIFGNSEVDAAFIEANAITVGIVYGKEGDSSQLQSATISSDNGNSTLNTSGSAKAIVRGDAEKVIADTNSRVEVYGNAASVDVYDKAVVTTNISTKAVTHVAKSTSSSSVDYTVGTTTGNKIVSMSQTFYNGSNLFKQWEDLGDLLTVASVDISDKLNLPAAVKTALFDHKNINQDAYLSADFTKLDLDDEYFYHPDSVSNYENAEDLSSYLINQYKDNLAKAMADLHQSKNSQIYSKLNEDIAKLAACSNNVTDLYKYFNAEELECLEVFSLDGSLGKDEIVEFLREFRFDENDYGVFRAAQQFEELKGIADTVLEGVEVTAKVAKAGMNVYDILQPLFRDYTNNVSYLDHMLATQPLEAELFVAAAELRLELKNKALAVANETLDKIKSTAVDALLDAWAPLKAGQAVIDVIGFVTGSTNYAEDTQKGAALCCMASEIYIVFENSINAVKNGDTSEEAVQMVYTSYTVLKKTLQEMCDVMTTIGSKSQKTEYKDILNKLNSMDLGEYVELAEYHG